MAAGLTYESITTTTLSSSSASVTFSSISGSYTDLIAIFNGGSTSAGMDIRCRFNGDSGSNYSFTYLTGNGSSASSGRANSQTFMPLDYNGYLNNSIQTVSIINLMNYSNSTTYKTTISTFNTPSYGLDLAAGLWRSTSAITSIEFFPSGNSFLTGSTFTLYGITKA